MIEASPMMAQYLSIKAQAAGCLLFFRMGDFYELFFDDAAKAAATLDIALTKRGQHLGQDIPMCGVPVHAAESYLMRLIRAGHRVAIAEQIEPPAEAKKRGAKSVVARAIVRVVTPGTLTEDTLLDARRSNYLAAVAPVAGAVGVAWCDVSTGAFRTLSTAADGVEAELARIAPAEVVAPEGWTGEATLRPAAEFESRSANKRLCDRFGVATLDGFGSFAREEVAAAGALLAYLESTGAGSLPLLTPPVPSPQAGVMAIDAATRSSLEISRSVAGARAGSLLDAIDLTATGAGARMLADDLAGPLTDAAAIGERLDFVAWFCGLSIVRGRTRDALKAGADLERALSRLALDRGGPRDLAAIRDGLTIALALKGALGTAQAIDIPPLLTATLDRIGAHGGTIEALRAALVEEPPLDIAHGGFIAHGFDAALDELRAAGSDGRRLVAALETRLRSETGVAALKIRHNGVLGYHIEVAARNADPLLANPNFTHRQTLAGTVRFGSTELHGLATRIAQAGDHALAAEAAHFETLRETVLGHAREIAATASALARIDVASGLAELAARENWARPSVDDSCAFEVMAGRHPVVEAATRAARQTYVANDCDLGEINRLWLVTGPNMAGKSTFLRQNALIAVLAQAGSFVPAASAHIGVVDRLFSRVGASDNLAQGRSTFMVEMVETAAILSTATNRSLVILDEVGRGTSTYDGLAIAWAVLEAVHDNLRCRCLFATHYHELTTLSARLDALALVTVKVREWNGELVFLHEVAAGAADRSYGLAVAKLAGLPAPVIARAKEVLARLEAGKARTGGLAADLSDLPLFAAAPPPAKSDDLRNRLGSISPDLLSPREALDLLYELKRLA
ncbi:MAG: DNA mismatch repair protein MutS [Janthinobacterium lividum]